MKAIALIVANRTNLEQLNRRDAKTLIRIAGKLGFPVHRRLWEVAFGGKGRVQTYSVGDRR